MRVIEAKSKVGGGKAKFDTKNDFRQVCDGTIDYVLYLSKEKLLYDIDRKRKEYFIEDSCVWKKRILRKFSDEDLDAVVEIFRRYTE